MSGQARFAEGGEPMQVLFVHGLGRSPLCGSALLRQLRYAGCRTSSFAYLAALESLERIVARLTRNLQVLARRGDYLLIGHSLGGVLLRMALQRLPAGTRLPCRLVLVASPVKAPRMARWGQKNRLVQLFSSDCGALLASQRRMAQLGAPPVSTLCVVGTQGMENTRRAFFGQANDGILAVSEVLAPWADETWRIDDNHLDLPSNAQLIEHLQEWLQQAECG
jgi:pimeloyl-ACP methyl ester carboxylesterase